MSTTTVRNRKKVVTNENVEVVNDDASTQVTTTVQTVDQVLNDVEESSSSLSLINDLILEKENQSKEARVWVNKLKAFKREFAKLEKRNKLFETKNLKKKSIRTPADPNAPPKGFNKPSTISTELAMFLGFADGDKIARAQVTKLIIKYIDEHKLTYPGESVTKSGKVRKAQLFDFNKEGGDKLAALFGVEKTEVVNIFTMQKFLNRHFPDSKKNLKLREDEKKAQTKTQGTNVSVDTSIEITHPPQEEVKSRRRRSVEKTEVAAA